MTKHRISAKGSQLLKRKRVVAVAEDNILTSEDDDGTAVVDAININICEMLDEYKVPPTTSTSNSIRALGETLRNTLLEINDIRERNRERRHKELLELLMQLNNDEVSDNNRQQQEHELSAQYIMDSTETAEAIHINILDSPTTAAQADDKITSVNSGQNVDPPKADIRSELQLMREQMIEMQRQKMEKRLERKKREYQYKEDSKSADKKTK